MDIREWTVEKGSFCLLAGTSGSGKTTLLRQLSGNTMLQGREEGVLTNLSCRTAYVWQDPESQVVTDRTEYEIVFGLENIHMPKEQMSRRLAEVVTFFGLEDLMNRDTMSLSGGEMQTLNVAAAVAMNPDLLLLDEPASQLDPVAAGHLYELLRQINEELGITVVIAEQRLEDIVSLADTMLLLQEGRIYADGTPEEVLGQVPESMLAFFPSFVQLFCRYRDKGEVPLSKKAARRWFGNGFQRKGDLVPDIRLSGSASQDAIRCRNLYFRYERSQPDILRDCSFSFPGGAVTCLAGGNGSGKSTFLKILQGRLRAYRGKMTGIPKTVSCLPQQPRYLFLGDTVKECCQGRRGMQQLAAGFGLADMNLRHPADLSGGELQRLGLCQVLGAEAELYLLDEPTRGLDPEGKEQFGRLMREMAEKGKTILIVSHDMEFAARYTDVMALMFQGDVSLVTDTRSFFTENQFYTTGINRISREVHPGIIIQEDVERYAEKKKL